MAGHVLCVGNIACRNGAVRIVLFLKLWLERLATPYRLPKVISKKVGDALLGVAANRQVCPTF